MSDQLYSTLLRWRDGCGVAKLHGIAVHLSGAPDLGSGAVFSLRYVPEVRMIRVHHWGGIERDMSDAEISAADALLSALCKG